MGTHERHQACEVLVSHVQRKFYLTFPSIDVDLIQLKLAAARACISVQTFSCTRPRPAVQGVGPVHLCCSVHCKAVCGQAFESPINTIGDDAPDKHLWIV